MDEPQKGTLNAAVAHELRTLRYEQGLLTGLTVEDFAKRSGIGLRTMPRYLNGSREIGVGQLEAMCKVLGIDPIELVTRAIAKRDARATGRDSSAQTG